MNHLRRYQLIAAYLQGNYARGLAEPPLIVGTFAVGYRNGR